MGQKCSCLNYLEKAETSHPQIFDFHDSSNDFPRQAQIIKTESAQPIISNSHDDSNFIIPIQSAIRGYMTRKGLKSMTHSNHNVRIHFVETTASSQILTDSCKDATNIYKPTEDGTFREAKLVRKYELMLDDGSKYEGE